MDIESRRVRDVEHKHKPDWATGKTPKGWTDCVKTPKGTNTFIDVDKRLSYSLGFEVKMNTEEKIPIILGNVTKHQHNVLMNASKGEIETLYESTKHAMRIDLAIVAKNKDDFPFPVFVEADGSQHERNGTRNNSSENHLDRVKDFCCRLNKNGIMIRVKSNENTSKKVEYLFSEIKRYYDTLSEGGADGDIRDNIQKYTDALCFAYANKNSKTIMLNKYDRPEYFISETQYYIIDKIRSGTGNAKGLSNEEIKLLNTWVRDKKDLEQFVKNFKTLEGEKEATHPGMYRGQYYEPYTFMDDIMEVLTKRNQKETLEYF